MIQRILILFFVVCMCSPAQAQLFPRLRQLLKPRRRVVDVHRERNSTPNHQQSAPIIRESIQGQPGSILRSANGASDALHIVNQKRAQRGLRPLAWDAAMTQAALKEAGHQAANGCRGHCYPMNSAGVKSGTGYASGGNLEGRFTTCYLYDRRATRGGAAIAYAGSNRAHYALMCK